MKIVSKFCQAENIDITSLSPDQIEAIVSKFSEATGCDKSELMQEFVAYITEYKEVNNVKKPKLTMTIGFSGYDLLNYRKWMKQNSVEIEGFVHLSEVYDDTNKVYYVEGSQEPIIDRMVFLKVQADMAERANLNSGGKKRVYSGKYALSSIVFCGHCGDIYRRIKWNNRGCKSTVWRCVSRIEKGGSACPARTINEEELQAAVIYAVNKLFSCKNRVIPTLMENVCSVIDGGMDEKIAEIDRLIREKQTELLANEKDMVKAEEIGNRIIELREEKQRLLTDGALEQDKIERLEDMKNFLDGQNDFLTEYSDALTRRLVEKVTVYDEKIMVLFRSGLEIELMA